MNTLELCGKVYLIKQLEMDGKLDTPNSLGISTVMLVTTSTPINIQDISNAVDVKLRLTVGRKAGLREVDTCTFTAFVRSVTDTTTKFLAVTHLTWG